MAVKLWTAALCALVVAGCVQTQEIPLQSNVWRLESSAPPISGAAGARDATLKRAAELTLQQGYTHFILTDANASNKSRVVGRLPTYTNVSVYGSGNSAFGQATTYGGEPIVSRRSNLGATVIMLRRGDPGFDRSFDARVILGALAQ